MITKERVKFPEQANDREELSRIGLPFPAWEGQGFGSVPLVSVEGKALHERQRYKELRSEKE